MVAYLYIEKTDGCRPFNINSEFKTDLPFAIVMNSKSCNPRIKALNAYHTGALVLIIDLDANEDYNEFMYRIHDINLMNTPITTLFVDADVRNKFEYIIQHFNEPLIKLKTAIPKINTAKMSINIVTNDLFFYKFLNSLDEVMNYFHKKIELDILLYRSNEDTNTLTDVAKMETMMNCLKIRSLFKVLGIFAEKCVSKLEVNSSCFESSMNSVARKEFLEWQNCYLKKTDSDTKRIVDRLNLPYSLYDSFLTINGRLYSGSFKPENVFEFICRSFVKSPSSCLYLNDKYVLSTKYTDIETRKETRRKWALAISLILIIALLTMGAFILFLLFGRIYKKIMEERVESIVKSSIDKFNSLETNE